ncbi:MAG: hypothetical protein IKE10_00340 [Bacilli bacterium]|nr:hypothetical protein [Bacilli bacterium]
MYKQIGRLLREHKNEELDKKFINDAFEAMVSHDKLEEYASELTFDDDDRYGLYDGNNKTININIKRINGLERSNYSKRLNALLILRHEIEHAKNLRKTITSEGIESAILQLSMFVAVKDEDASISASKPLITGKSELYGLNANERIADIRSTKFMVNLLKNDRNSDALIQSRVFLYNSYVKGYRDNGTIIDCPTYLYLLKSGFIRYYFNLVKLISDHEPYSLDTRVLCGLPITREEKDLVLLNKAGLKEIPKK